MGSFKLGLMTLGSLFKKPETVLYPAETKNPPTGLKGHIVNDVDNCILCGICQKTCPCSAIVVEKKEARWDIDRFLCIQCGSCVRACPKACLAMDPAYTPVTGAKYCDTYSVPVKEKKKTEASAE